MANYIAQRRSSGNPNRGQTFRTPPLRSTPSLTNRTRVGPPPGQILTPTVVRSVPNVVAFLFRNTPYGRVYWFLRPLLEDWALQGIEWLLKKDPWQKMAFCAVQSTWTGTHVVTYTHYVEQLADYVNACELSSQGGPPGQYVEQDWYTGKYESVIYNPFGIPGLERAAVYGVYRRNVGEVPLEVWVRSPSRRIEEEPRRLPQIIPMDKPILKPSPAPVPIPWPLIPDRAPDPFPDGSDRGNEDPRAPEQPPRINYDPPVRIRPDSPVWLSVNPPRRPPDRREKEKKFGGSSDAVQEFFRRVSRFKEAQTELWDMLEAIHKAIDPKILRKLKKERGKGNRPTPQSMAKDIYDNFNKIDWEKALDNVVENWIEDKAMGTAISASDRAAKKLGLKATLQGRGWMPRW